MPIEVIEGQDKIWRPNPGQQEKFLSLPDSIQEGFYGGALGGGKTEILLMLPIARGLYKHPRFNAIIFRRTFPEVEKSLVQKSKEYYPLVGGKYNDTYHRWSFPSGAVINFGYLDILDDVRRHDGVEYNYIGFDELEHFLRDQYILLMARCRSKVKELPKIIRSTGMPGGVGHSWVRERFVEPYKFGGKIILDKVSESKRIFIPAKLTDNPKLTENDPDYINKLKNLSEVEQRAKIDGDWWAYLGQVFNEFRPSGPYSDEPSWANHVVSPFPIPSWWDKVAAVDWGFEHSTAIHKAAISPDNRIFVYYEQIAKREYISKWARDFRRNSQGETFKSIVIDPSARQRRGDDKTIEEQFADHSGFIPDLADNDRVGGKMLYHEYLRWKPRPARYVPQEGFNIETANRILRIRGDKALQDYESLFLPEKEETGLPKLQIFSTCKELIKVIPALVYDDKNTEDVQKFDGDDAYDSSRYLFKACERFLDGTTEEAKRREKLGGILHAVQTTGDQTTFYRQMERFEAERGGAGNRGFRLFH